MSQLRTAWKPGEQPPDLIAGAKRVARKILLKINGKLSRPINTASGRRYAKVGAVFVFLFFLCAWAATKVDSQSPAQGWFGLFALVWFLCGMSALGCSLVELHLYGELKRQIAAELAAEKLMRQQTPHGNAQFATAEDLRRGGYIE